LVERKFEHLSPVSVIPFGKNVFGRCFTEYGEWKPQYRRGYSSFHFRVSVKLGEEFALTLERG
jgi:hypothetical protein